MNEFALIRQYFERQPAPVPAVSQALDVLAQVCAAFPAQVLKNSILA